MSTVLTLIADPAAPALDGNMVDAARAALLAAGAEAGPPDWLAPGVACDVPCAGADAAAAAAAVRGALAGAPVDVLAQAAAIRRKRVLVADMESTIIRNELLDDLGILMGVGDRVSEITAKAMNGEIDFVSAIKQRTALLEGLPAERLAAVRQRIVFAAGARELLRTMRAHDGYAVLVSGGFRIFTRYVRERLGFDEDIGNEPEIRNGCLSGRVLEPILDRDAKLRALTRIARERGVSPEETLAVGDGANDLPMIQAAGTGIAYHAKPALAEAAAYRIDHGDLTALLYLQGYRAEEIVGSADGEA